MAAGFGWVPDTAVCDFFFNKAKCINKGNIKIPIKGNGNTITLRFFINKHTVKVFEVNSETAGNLFNVI